MRKNGYPCRANINHFLEIAPLMMFLRYTCGLRCWHSVNDYANLTIDDPWLVEPYGYLSYKELLGEMEEHNFHTTIAFIPWNFDRSKEEVVSILLNHSNRFSVCVHGNNHDHKEFNKYEIKPLDVQDSNIIQAIARMEKFKSLTNVPYERVMVFPHGIAPSNTLRLLKKYNFLGTVNARNIPLGSTNIIDDPFLNLRPIFNQIEGFPSLKRYSAKYRLTAFDIAVDLFLDNPLFFCAHHDLFKTGIGAFNKKATIVNEIQPAVIWQSLAHIIQHLYLEKMRDDGNYDILSFSNNIVISNDSEWRKDKGKKSIILSRYKMKQKYIFRAIFYWLF